MTTQKASPEAIKTLKGTSGAKITITPDCVIKSADPLTPVGLRVIEQGVFCTRMGVPILPRVYNVNDQGSYVMEVLDLMPWWVVDYHRLYMSVVENLFRYFWTGDHGVKIDNSGWQNYHWAYVSDLCEKHTPGLMKTLLDRWVTVREADLREGLVHGDPTFDNCMLRGDQLVITDPIPADGKKIPNLIAVDVGKTLQSAVGYETIKYGREQDIDMYRALKLMNLDTVERNAAIYFCGVHILRLLPYQPDELKPKFVEILKRVLVYH